MKKVLSVLLLVSLIVVLVACGDSELENSGPTNVNDINLEPLEAELIIPETADSGDELTLQVIVTQGEENVDDATEVMFEVWIDGEKSDSEMIEADLSVVNGKYEVSYTFTEEALYNVQPHVTARGSHVMPVGNILIGDVEIDEENDEDDHNDHEHRHDEHLHESLTLEWNTTDFASVDDNVTVSVNVEWEDGAWVDGDVRFEIWKHGDELREWIDGEEVTPGRYETVHSFSNEGDYHIMVHLEDESIHEHVQYSVTIK